MKKYIVLLAIAVCSLLRVEAQTEMEVPSKLNKVMVFPFEAQLFNSADVQLPGNTVLLKFTNLSPYINPKSIHVVGDDNMNILNVSFRKDFLSQKIKNIKIKELDKKINDLRDRVKTVEMNRSIVNDRTSYLKTHEALSREFVTQPEKFEDLCNYFTGYIKENKEEDVVYNRQINTLNDSIRIYQNEANELNYTHDEPSGTILVLVNSAESRKASFEVSYTLNNVWWSPSYNIRFEGVNHPLKLDYKANVLQQSGLDWNDVNITLSTAQTQKSSDIPILHPLFLGYVYKERFVEPVNTDNREEYNSFRGNEYKAPIYDENSQEGMKKIPIIDSLGRVKYVIQKNNSLFGESRKYAQASSADAALQGKLAGVNISSTEGSPDAESRMRVRGGGSLTQNNGPLYIVDGVPVSDISNIAPTDIESVDVMKDNQATAIYGAQGASGVVIIKTKNAAGKQSGNVAKVDSSLLNYRLDLSAKRKPATATFDVPDTQTIKSGMSTQVPFREEEVPCVFQYKAIPKLSEKVYLTALIPNWSDLDLQSADVNLYFENAFIGNSKINAATFNDTLQVSFGPDQGISVKREKVKDFTEKVSFSSKHEQTVSWRITIKNNKKEDVNVDVFDQIPITNNDDFSVKTLELSGGELNKTTGQVKWSVALPAGGSKELMFTIQVKYPKGRKVILK